MKPLLRILVILLFIAIVAIALRPPEKEKVDPETHTQTETESPAPTPAQNLIRDLLGGAAIDSGQQAKDTISEVNQRREEDFKETGL